MSARRTAGYATDPRPHRHRRDSGQIGGIEVLPLGVLVFVVGALLIVNAWAVIDAKLGASTAAREAARTYVEAPAGSDSGRAWARAEGAARHALVASGKDPARATIHPVAGSFERCVRVVVEVGYTVPTITLPFVGGFGDGFVVRDRHSELVDPYRSGLGGAGCA